MIWTLVLLLTSGGGTWIAAKRWYGWVLSWFGEVLWLIYSVTIHSLPLFVLSWVWFFIHGANIFRSRKRERELKSLAADRYVGYH